MLFILFLLQYKHEVRIKIMFKLSIVFQEEENKTFIFLSHRDFQYMFTLQCLQVCASTHLNQ